MISLIQTAEGALQETHAILQRMRELAVQSANDTNMDDVDREAMQQELDALVAEINDIAERTEFNTQKLIDGSFNGKVFHIGANKGQNIEVSIAAMDAEGIGLNKEITITTEVAAYIKDKADASDIEIEMENPPAGTYNVLRNNDDNAEIAAIEVDGAYYALSDVTVDDTDSDNPVKVKSGAEEIDPDAVTEQLKTFTGVNISTREQADASIQLIDDAINEVSTQRSALGAIQNRLEHTINNLGASQENLTAAESRIRDTDMAKEMMEFTKNSILSQAAQAMLAQSQQIPQGVLQLLQ